MMYNDKKLFSYHLNIRYDMYIRYVTYNMISYIIIISYNHGIISCCIKHRRIIHCLHAIHNDLRTEYMYIIYNIYNYTYNNIHANYSSKPCCKAKSNDENYTNS